MSIWKHHLNVKLDQESHRYFDQHGREYISQSAFVGLFKQKFDAKAMSKRSAAKELAKEGAFEQGKELSHLSEEVNRRAEAKQQEWKAMGDQASIHGNIIHNQLESFGKGMTVDPSFMPLCNDIYAPHLNKHKWFNEKVLFLEEEGIAGTSDLPIARSSHVKGIIDIDDFKTNVRRGIEFHSKYGNWMKYPIDHLEDCNYNHYALQLSLYGYMIMKTFNRRVGTLTIRYIKAILEGEKLKDYMVINYPVPFMYHEIEAMLEYYMAIKANVQEQEAVEFLTPSEPDPFES